MNSTFWILGLYVPVDVLVWTMPAVVALIILAAIAGVLTKWGRSWLSR